MKKAKMSKLKYQISIYCLILLFVICNLSFATPQVLAIESSPSASQSADLKSKLKILQAEIASRAAGMKNEVTKKLQNKAYIGTVKSKDNNSLILSVRGSDKNINVSEFTEYVIKAKKSIGNQGLKNITIDSTVACLGDIDDKGTLSAKKIVKLNSPVPILPKIISGVLTSVVNGKANLQTSRKDQFLVTFDKDTGYQLGESEGSFNDIRINKSVIVSGESTNSANLSAAYVYIYPNAVVTKTKIATPSAAPIKK